jgi:transposase-like protein
MNCPSCHRVMVKNGKTPEGKQRWICKKGHTAFDKDDYAPSTIKRAKKMMEWWFK